MLLLSVLCLIGTTLAVPVPQDNMIDDIISSSLIVPFFPMESLIRKREVINLDLLKPIIEPFIYPAIDKRGVQTQDNLLDIFVDALGVLAPVISAGKRDVADSEWFDTFLAAVEAATPTILGVIQGATTTREINWDLITPIIEPLILPVLYKRALETQDNLFDIFVDAIGVLAPVISAGKRELTEEQANLFGDILGVVETIAPLALAVGKREVEDSLFEFGIGPVTAISRKDLTEEQENLFGDILGVVETIAPLALAIGKREVNWEELLAVVANTPPTFICDFGCIGKREVADSEWFDTFLSAVEAATPTILGVIQGATTTREINWDLIKPIIDPLILPVLYKRAVVDSEWFDTFLAAVEAATPTILGVIQGATTTREVADAEWFNTLINAVEAFTPTIVGMINNVKQRKDIDWDYMLQILDNSTPLVVGLTTLQEPGKKRQAETEVQDTMYIDGSVLLDSITPVVSPVINILTGKRQAESEDTLFELLVDAIGVLGPAIAAGKRNMNWPTVLDIPIIQPLIVPALSKKAINWDLIKPIIEPLILPVLSKRALETQDINFEKFGIYSRPDLEVPLITAEDLDPAFLAGKRNLENQDNLLDIFVDALGVLAPVISAGKRDLESQDNLLDIFVDALGVLAPVISAGKKRCWGCILDDLKVIEVPTPLITVGRREITYWEAFQKYLDEGGIFPVIPEGVIIVKKEA